MRALVLAALAGLTAAAPAARGGCIAGLTTLCVLRDACLERPAPGVATLVQYGVPAGAEAVAVPPRPMRWSNVTVAASPRPFAEAVAGARALFRGSTLLSVMYQMHLPHYLEDALATLPLYLRPADFGLDGPPQRNPLLLGHVSPPGFYKYGYHRAFQALFSNASTDWEGGVLADDAFHTDAWAAFWSKLALPGDDVRPTGDRLCFETVAFNTVGRWHHSVADARALRARVAADWGLAYSHDDVCVLQRRDHRAIANLDEVVAMLKRRTGKCVRVFQMESRPPHGQATLMATCGVLVTPHGANEINVNFLPEGALVVELVPAVFHLVIDYFKGLSISNGLRTHHVVVPYERLHNDKGCLATHAGAPWGSCYTGVGECHWCYKQSNMTVIEADFEGVL
jgi:hypothetical protein